MATKLCCINSQGLIPGLTMGGIPGLASSWMRRETFLAPPRAAAPSTMRRCSKVDKNGKESVLINFADRLTGGLPYGDLVLDANSNLYGTSAFGGRYGSGNVFKTSETGKETVLHQFTGAADGAIPLAGLVQDTHGNLYGVTFQGGNLAGCMTAGCRTADNQPT